MITLDGSIGEGGGQILRSSLSLSLFTGKPFTITNIRAARPSPGLRPQHLAAVRAAAKISGANVEGDRVSSQRLVFEPGPIQPGHYHFEVGTAGSTTLVLQTILLPLALAEGASHLSIMGGTHVPWSPCYHYIDWHWRILLARMGFHFEMRLNRAGFYPQGGGELEARITGYSQPRGIHLNGRGTLRRIRGLSAVANLATEIAERQRHQALSRLNVITPQIEAEISVESFSSYSRGTVLLLLAEFDESQACFFALGAPGKPAERVADEAIDAFAAFLKSDGAVDPWLADQIVLPMALADNSSQIRTSAVTQHLLTNANVIQYFLPVNIEIDSQLNQPCTVRICRSEHKNV